MVKKRTRLWLLPVMLAAAGFCYLDNCTVQTTFRTLRCATLPEAFSGLRIVQISDLHGRVFGKEHAALLSAVRAAKPDFIAITGDLADEDTALPSLRPLLAGLTALAPVYYVTGNHEWVTPAPCGRRSAICWTAMASSVWRTITAYWNGTGSGS